MSREFEDFDFGDWSENSIKITRKVPICLVLDNSGSMQGQKIQELNFNVHSFINYVESNAKAARICDLSIITFGFDGVRVVSGYSEISKTTFHDLHAGGPTPLGGAVRKAIDLLNIRRGYYKNNYIEHYKPIMLLMSDGEPTDDYAGVAAEFSRMVMNKELKIFPVGIGMNFNKAILRKFSPILEPKVIHNREGFSTLFKLLSSSSSSPEDDSLEKWFNDEV